MAELNLLHHCSFSEGGLARYAEEQRKALSDTDRSVCYSLGSKIDSPSPILPGKPGRALSFIQSTVREQKYIARESLRERPDWLILSSWSEYLAPFWSHHLNRVHKKEIRVAALVHDPVRDYVRGPQWFHNWSIRQAYSFVDVVFVHDASEISWGGLRQRPKVVEIPHGPYPVPLGASLQAEVRNELKIPEDAFTILSFGHIRDGKNLDLLLHALQKHKNPYLIIAGKEQSGGQKSLSEYKEIAARLNISERCCWFNDYIPEKDVWKYFTASDAVALTYSSDFRSASGVLNVNAQFRKPVLASGGLGPLKTAMKRYQLGPWVEPDSTEDIERGLTHLLNNPQWPEARWDAYLRDHSWEENARRVIDALESYDRNR